MSRRAQVLVGGLVVLLTGCRTATHVTEVPRVDLEVSGGNRGFLVGTPPPTSELKTTRQMVETNIEVPSFYKAKHTSTPVSLEAGAPATDAASAPDESRASVIYDTYVVQKGDSLWSIAAKPEIYGKATRWRRIFDANRELLKSPERVRAGMTLKIPRGEERGPSTTYSDQDATSKK